MKEIERQMVSGKWEKRGSKTFHVQTFLVSLEVRDILERIKDNSWTIPDLQRDSNAWKIKQKSELIDSIIKGYPIPGMMIVTPSSKKTQYILDGQQRIQTLIEYIEKESFRLKLDETNIYNKKRFSELNESIKNKIKRTVIGIQNVTSTSPINDDSYMYEIFARINSGGTSLSRQEVRNALNASTAMENIKEYSKKIIRSELVNLFPEKNNYNKIISWIFRISYFIHLGKSISDINKFQHKYSKNPSLDNLLDKYTAEFFDKYKDHSYDIIKNEIDIFTNEIKNNELERWLMAFDSNFKRKDKAQTTFMDSLAIYFGINKKLSKFKDQLEIFKNINIDNVQNYSFKNYRGDFQQKILNENAIIKRYKVLFEERYENKDL